MNNLVEEFLWTEKYRPKTIDECILPDAIKKKFKSYVEQGNAPNLLLYGPPGIGKTTVATALTNELGGDHIIINGSLEGNIDTLRVKLVEFVSRMSLTHNDQRKYVIIDEADYLNPQSFQPAFRKFMEDFSDTCGFILTCNYPKKIIKPIHSRCSVINFSIPKEEKPKQAKAFFLRLKEILDKEGIEYDDKVLAKFIGRHFPDYRRMLNELHAYASCGVIDVGILSQKGEREVTELLKILREKNYEELMKWVAANEDIPLHQLNEILFSKFKSELTKSSIPIAILHMAEFEYKASFVENPRINTLAMLTKIMVDVEFI